MPSWRLCGVLLALRAAGAALPAARVVGGGATSSCSVSAAGGALACFGLDDVGQASAPAGAFLTIGVGAYGGCGIREGSGALACWGQSDAGQLAAPAGAFGDVACGAAHCCAVVLGAAASAVLCWGSNVVSQSAPPAGVGAAQVTAGDYFTCAVDPGGRVRCWGLSLGGSIPSGAFAAVQVSAGSAHACAIFSDGAAACAGANAEGQAAPPVGVRLTAIACGGHMSCGLDLGGAVLCWGDPAGFSPVPRGSGGLLQVAAGALHVCAVSRDGTVACSGNNALQQASPPPGLRARALCAGGFGAGVGGIAAVPPFGCGACPPGFHSLPGWAFCDPCDGGLSSSGGAAVCTPCGLGTYAVNASVSAYVGGPNVSTTLCAACAAGFRGAASLAAPRAACAACAAGSYSGAGDGSCADCPAGWSSPSGAAVCSPCARGTFSGAPRAASCAPCGAGTYAPAPAATSCLLCEPGTWSGGGAARCTPCAAGSFSTVWRATSASVCVPCPRGRESDVLGASSAAVCVDCPPSSFSPDPGASSCQPCPSGYAGTLAGQASLGVACTECPRGWYSEIVGARECIACRTGTYSEVPGASTASTCTACPPNYDTTGAGTGSPTECFPCMCVSVFWAVSLGLATSALAVATLVSVQGLHTRFAVHLAFACAGAPRVRAWCAALFHDAPADVVSDTLYATTTVFTDRRVMYAAVAFTVVPLLPFLIFVLYVHPPGLAWSWALLPPREWTNPLRAAAGVVGAVLCVALNTVRWIVLGCVGVMLYLSKALAITPVRRQWLKAWQVAEPWAAPRVPPPSDAPPSTLPTFPRFDRGVSQRAIRHVFLVFPQEADVKTLFSAVHYNYMLFAELVIESLPQIFVQGANNSKLVFWNWIVITSISISSAIALSHVTRFARHLGRCRPLAETPTGIGDSMFFDKARHRPPLLQQQRDLAAAVKGFLGVAYAEQLVAYARAAHVPGVPAAAARVRLPALQITRKAPPDDEHVTRKAPPDDEHVTRQAPPDDEHVTRQAPPDDERGPGLAGRMGRFGAMTSTRHLVPSPRAAGSDAPSVEGRAPEPAALSLHSPRGWTGALRAPSLATVVPEPLPTRGGPEPALSEPRATVT